MADISAFDNFFDNFPPKSGFATKRHKISECTIDQVAFTRITMKGMNIFYNPRCSASIAAQLCALFSKTISYSSGI